jgi:hypothetical protein
MAHRWYIGIAIFWGAISSAKATVYCRNFIDSSMIYRNARTGDVTLAYRDSAVPGFNAVSTEAELIKSYNAQFQVFEGKETTYKTLKEEEYFTNLVGQVDLPFNPLADNFKTLDERIYNLVQSNNKTAEGRLQRIKTLNQYLGGSSKLVISEGERDPEICRSFVFATGVNQSYRPARVAQALKFLNGVGTTQGATMQSKPQQFNLYTVALSLYYGARSPEVTTGNAVWSGRCYNATQPTYPYSSLLLYYQRDGRSPHLVPYLGSRALWDEKALTAENDVTTDFFQAAEDEVAFDRWRASRSLSGQTGPIQWPDSGPHDSAWIGRPATFSVGKARPFSVREITTINSGVSIGGKAEKKNESKVLIIVDPKKEQTCIYDKFIGTPN